jgi:hypothetical protein
MRTLAKRKGLFGPIRVIERKSDGARTYCIKASAQTMIQSDGVSLFGYVHAAKLLLKPSHKILLIGGGGGSLATMLARDGHDVTVLEIDPAAEELARTYFGLDRRVRWITGDLEAFFASHHESFDAACIDACNADGLIRDFSYPDFLSRLLALACPNGSLILNLVHEDGAPPWGEWLAWKLTSSGLHATLYSPEDGWEGNELLHIRAHGPTDTLSAIDVYDRPPETRTYLLSLRAFTPRHHTD